MKAIGIKTSLPIDDPNSLIAFETSKPAPTGHDILVKVKAVSVNPVDYKVRQNSAKGTTLNEPRILGWDAVGVVESVGDKVSLFKAGDEVFYAGSIGRAGSNSEYQLIDERIVGKKPRTLSDAQAAAVPLTALTAWEAMFDRMCIQKNSGEGRSILIIGGAAGVGSIAIQLAKKLTKLTVIATASRPESANWCKQLGADVVVDHNDLVTSVRKARFDHIDYILNFVNTESYWAATSELIKAQGRICSIVESKNPLDMTPIRSKSVSFSWELMFTRSMFQTDDMIEQHRILNQVSELLDNKTLVSTLTTTLQGFSVENFIQAHKLLESGKAVGKLVIVF